VNPLPSDVTKSRLWNRVSGEPRLIQALENLRSVASALGDQIARLLPGYTDHSVEHMDALWRICDVIFTAKEVDRFTVAEAFVLGCCFYVHDLGMAFAATKEGARELKCNPAFTSALERTQKIESMTTDQAELVALQVAARELHAVKSEALVTQELPGLGRFLLEPFELRQQWSALVGLVSASHHWPISEVQKKLGERERIPSPIGDEIDPAVLACALRVSDAAHINSERARYLDQLLRADMPIESLVHWRAQEHITGPTRQGDLLVFASQKPIEDVDGWWLFFEMASGVDAEIRSVSEYLAGRSVSKGRFSLEGVKRVRSPQAFAELVETRGFQPIDVRVRADSMERLVEILGGRQLYGEDYFAPVRELLQNARDAVALDRAAAKAAGVCAQAGEIDVRLRPNPDGAFFEVSDNGIGMTQRVITDYLLGVASSYWDSPDFFTDFPGVRAQGFAPAGRFGIGFLSVFMVGSNVEVETERRGYERLMLHLRGVGRRGSLVSGTARAQSGTTVRVSVSPDKVADFESLAAIVRCRAPMLEVPIVVFEKGMPSTIKPGWWAEASQEELFDFVVGWNAVACMPAPELRRMSEKDARVFRRPYGYRGTLSNFKSIPYLSKWPGKQPEVLADNFRVLAMPNTGAVLLCSRGVAIDVVNVPSVVGLVEVGDLEMTTARSAPLQWDSEAFRQNLIKSVGCQVLAALKNLEAEGRIPSRFKFLSDVADAYGDEMLLATDLPWIGMVEPPGNVRLITPKQLADCVKKKAEILLGYGTGPWDLESRCRTVFPGASRDALLLPVSDSGEPSHGSWEDKDDFTRGPLKEHFGLDRFSRGERAPRLLCTLRIIAEAWNVRQEALVTLDWCRNKTNWLCGHLVREKL